MLATLPNIYIYAKTLSPADSFKAATFPPWPPCRLAARPTAHLACATRRDGAANSRAARSAASLPHTAVAKSPFCAVYTPPLPSIAGRFAVR